MATNSVSVEKTVRQGGRVATKNSSRTEKVPVPLRLAQSALSGLWSLHTHLQGIWKDETSNKWQHCDGLWNLSNVFHFRFHVYKWFKLMALEHLRKHADSSQLPRQTVIFHMRRDSLHVQANIPYISCLVHLSFIIPTIKNLATRQFCLLSHITLFSDKLCLPLTALPQSLPEKLS